MDELITFLDMIVIKNQRKVIGKRLTLEAFLGVQVNLAGCCRRSSKLSVETFSKLKTTSSSVLTRAKKESDLGMSHSS